MPALPAEAVSVAKAHLLADASTPLDVSSSAGGLTIGVPRTAPDPDASVLVLELSQ